MKIVNLIKMTNDKSQPIQRMRNRHKEDYKDFYKYIDLIRVLHH